MRKKAIILLVLITALVFNIPQYCSAQGLSFGLKGGINMSKFTGADAGENNMKTGLVGGAYVLLDLMVLNIQPEILYSQKGAKYELLGVTIEESLDYIEIPVLVKFPLGKVIVPSIYAGPSFGMLAKADVLGIDTKDYYKSTDLGLVVGVDVKTPVKLTIDARYNIGLSAVDEGDIYTRKNSTISLMLGYTMF